MIAQLSDPHVRVGPGDRGSAEALAAAVAEVLALERAPDAVLVSGDLADGALGELLAAAPWVRRVVAGHVHRTAFGVLGGCGVAVCPSTHMQARLEIGAREYSVAPEPAAVALHVALGGDVVSHIQPVGARLATGV